MDSSWIKSPSGRRVIEHWADARPSWLWSQDGRTLLWRNTAARFFQAKPRKGDRAPSGEIMASAGEIAPIRGQVARLIRLGSPNRASLSRMQFLAGEQAVSATCACTPVNLPDEQLALLVVHVDPIEAAQFAPSESRDKLLEAILPPGSDYLLMDEDGAIGGSPMAIERYAPIIADQGMPTLDAEGNGRLDTESAPFTALKASPQGASLLLFEATAGVATPAAPVTPEAEPVSEPLLPLGLPPLPAAPVTASGYNDADDATIAVAPANGGLTSLFDRLMDDSALFSPLSADEDFVPSVPAPPAVREAVAPDSSEEVHVEAIGPSPMTAGPEAVASQVATSEAGQQSEATETPAPPELGAFLVTAHQFTPLEAQDESLEGVAHDAALLGDYGVRRLVEGSSGAQAKASEAPDDDTEPAVATVEAPVDVETPPVIDVEAPVGHGIEATDGDADPMAENTAAAPLPETPEITGGAPPAGSPADDTTTSDAESVERVSRYNFDELSRILNDRVGGGESEPARAVTPMPRFGTPAVPSATPSGALVTLGGETLVLNRLPLGILVFREQQMLFANRAITEMTGYDSVEALRAAGLGAIFSAGDEQDAGPVNHLVQRDGTLVPVTARLQSVSWQGKPALMLSASATEVRTGHEAAVKAFAEHLASARADGFFETSRAGIIAYVSGDARLILKRQEEQLLGRPVVSLIAPSEIPPLREFFERPARFAETARPAITLKGFDRGIEIMLFAQGQAGIISGYFGFVRQTGNSALPAIAVPQGDADPALLTRLSRGVRRPLNTVIGFSDLIGSAAFGEIENQRYVEYAHDIKTAGLEIAALVDELDDFARLRDGRYAARPSEIDLAVLLDSTVMRVRGQANAARVLVRSAISERLPRVRADRASLSQAILNLLASAIDQTPQDGSVVLSAQVDDGGGVIINVRDSANNIADLGERFVVFRDGIGRDGQALTPIRSSVGLALTRALLEVNQASLNVDPAGGAGTMFSLTIPAESVVEPKQLPAGPTPDATR
jgi:signal transduction histidine kinase